MSRVGRAARWGVAGLLGLLVAGVGLVWWVGPCRWCGGAGCDPQGGPGTRCPECEGTGW